MESQPNNGFRRPHLGNFRLSGQDSKLKNSSIGIENSNRSLPLYRLPHASVTDDYSLPNLPRVPYRRCAYVLEYNFKNPRTRGTF